MSNQPLIGMEYPSAQTSKWVGDWSREYHILIDVSAVTNADWTLPDFRLASHAYWYLGQLLQRLLYVSQVSQHESMRWSSNLMGKVPNAILRDLWFHDS